MTTPATNKTRYRSAQAYEKWNAELRKSEAGANAMKALINLTTNTSSQFATLENLVLRACFNASIFYTHGDGNYRDIVKRLSEFADSLEEQRRAARTLKQKSASYPDFVSKILRYGRNRVKGLPRREGSQVTPEPSDVFLAMLSAYEKGLPQFKSILTALKYDFGRVEGCLKYPRRRRLIQNRLPGALNSLLFELTLLLRRWSIGASLDIHFGDSIPIKGGPHYGVVAAFANATFPDLVSITGPEVRNRLKKLLTDHPGIVYFPW